MEKKLLEGNIAFVTGASRGIGMAITLELAKQGAIVIGTATTQNGADGITRQLEEISAPGMGVVMNVNDVDQIGKAFEMTNKQFGDISILVNNAGITRDNLLVRMKDEEWDEVMTTNLKSIFYLSKIALRAMMKARSGRIINISSVVGATGNPGQANYAASKAGMIGFTKSLAREVGSRNVTINCVAPGFIDTDMTSSLTTEQRLNLLKQIPLGRLGQSADIAAAVVFLASPAASYITGTTLHVNGGMFME
ncbi:MAG TPA: 3-oxoacyl-ACP reductase FabG [Nitrosomonas sp.]|nr:3-oxoacyl-ACP reductase FabG [Nitrosomonas sp.]HMW19560.1 3-oxoacyl-ACP reductase FabG [Nitrosomonas sp.]HMW68061.1 3-oxoacyl-ACP reductase FabG [Nitrosomonas sp.]HMY89647.1 3-oxoacyl-ACP reductase FabG [Nitrosomonas sp.]HNA70365.1 3-oxoacyl-ACP reductase FabG [Nitrosomonas sp.]